MANGFTKNGVAFTEPLHDNERSRHSAILSSSVLTLHIIYSETSEIMGINHGSDVHHRLTRLRRRDVIKIAKELAREKV